MADLRAVRLSLRAPLSARLAASLRAVSMVLLVAASLLLLWQLLPRLALFVNVSVASLRYPWVIDAAEAVNIQSAYTIAQGHDPYGTDPHGFVATPYPPVYLALAALWLRLGGLSLLGGRVLSLLATCAVAGLAGALVARETGQRLAGLLAGGLFLACGPTIVWAAFYRQDLLALACGLAGLVWLARWPQGRWLYGALVPFVLAVYTKQSALAAPVAGCLYLLWRDRRGGLRFSLACAAALALPLVPLDLLTRHGFWRQVVADHALWQFDSFWRHLQRLVAYHAVLLPLAALGFVLLLRRRRPALVVCYAPLAVGTIVGSGVVGANNNHLLEPLLASCILVGALAGLCGARWRHPSASALLVATLLLAVQLPRMGAVAAWYDTTLLPSAARAARLTQATELIRQGQGEILTDDSFLLLRAGKDGAYQNVPMLGALASAGRWDETPLLQDLARHRFALIVIDTDVTRPDLTGSYWSAAALAALQRYYRLLYRDVVFTYVPRP